MLLVCLTALPSSRAAELPAIPERADADAFKQSPAPWRDYFIRARHAQRISDPLQRCLAFPDLPGNKWPLGHAAAHCRHHYAVKRPTLAEIEGMIERGELDQLEARMEASLARHYSDTDFGEDIHDTFDYLLNNGSADTDRVTAAWLRTAPDSAYAHLARGAFYRGSAWAARGGKYAAETPDDNMRRMRAFVDLAIPQFEKAASINPRLIPAFTGLVDVGMLSSRAKVERSGTEHAGQLDPACLELANARMRALTPRWGGSYEQMLAYANSLSAYLGRRPQLAIHVSAPFADRGDRLIAAKQYTRATEEILEIAVFAGSDEDALRDAANVVLNREDGESDLWKGVAYLLQGSRFRETDAWSQRWIASVLVKPEPEWSLMYSQPAVEAEDENTYGQYLLAAGYYNTKQYELADKHYRIALEDEAQRRTSLLELSTMWLVDSGLKGKAAAARAKPYIERLNEEYPDDGAGWIMQFNLRIADQKPIDDELLKTILKVADRKEPWQANAVKKIEEMRRGLGFK